MSTTKLHIVAFDIPYPPDYGGAVDIFYKLRALHKAGVLIYLHCFAYGRNESRELKEYCQEVWYYKRKTGIAGLSFTQPYIVSSRQNQQLLDRLSSIDAPILFEGIHTTFYLGHALLAKRKKALRIHNIEHDYYRQLAMKEKSALKKMYFLWESRRLANNENALNSADAFFALSRNDSDYFRDLYPAAVHHFVAPFHSEDSVMSKVGTGDYCLYHGNLSHPENREAAFYLLREVVPSLGVPLVIAGRNPGKDLSELCSASKSVTLVANPDITTMQELISNAQVHLLPTFQTSGMKLKLLNALFNGRHVIANKEMLFSTGLVHACRVATDAGDFIAKTKDAFAQPFTLKDIADRETMLKDFNNDTNAGILIDYFREGLPQ